MRDSTAALVWSLKREREIPLLQYYKQFNSTHLAVCIVAALHKGDDDNDKEDNKDIAGDFSN